MSPSATKDQHEQHRVATVARGLVLVAGTCAIVTVSSVAAQQKTVDPQAAVDNAFSQFRTLKEGKNAEYIPPLAKVDSLGGNPFAPSARKWRTQC